MLKALVVEEQIFWQATSDGAWQSGMLSMCWGWPAAAMRCVFVAFSIAHSSSTSAASSVSVLQQDPGTKECC